MGIGHDEEIGGPNGAAALAQLMRKQNAKVSIVWDEGMVVLSDGLGNLIKQPVAMIGTSEKVNRSPKPCSRNMSHSVTPFAFFCGKVVV